MNTIEKLTKHQAAFFRGEIPRDIYGHENPPENPPEKIFLSHPEKNMLHKFNDVYGYKFYLSDNNVWLTDHVPSEYISE